MFASLAVEESIVKETVPSEIIDPVVIQGKPKRKSAIKAATTFSKFAEDEIDFKTKKVTTNGRSKGESAQDDDFKISEGKLNAFLAPSIEL